MLTWAQTYTDMHTHTHTPSHKYIHIQTWGHIRRGIGANTHADTHTDIYTHTHECFNYFTTLELVKQTHRKMKFVVRPRWQVQEAAVLQRFSPTFPWEGPFRAKPNGRSQGTPSTLAAGQPGSPGGKPGHLAALVPISKLSIEFYCIKRLSARHLENVALTSQSWSASPSSLLLLNNCDPF